MAKNPRLKSIAEFLDGNHHFIIPSYQRGYRWEEQQILDLLNDIFEFQEEIKKREICASGEFYCLQPIIVLDKGNNIYEVIDGQQRLTTIFILLASLKDALEILNLPTTFFSIEYETREKENYNSKDFLNDITSVTDICKKNIDFYRMSSAFLIIKEWLKNNKINRGDFCNTLLKMDFEYNIDRANNIRFIWYELNSEGDKPNIAFAKYNQGKIDLTNAELIKAIFYLSDITKNDRERKKYQLKIGYEWDDIENTLRENNFWKFINPSGREYTNRIEFIFELIAEKYSKDANLKINKSIDRYWSFHIFNKLIADNKRHDDRHDNTRDFLWDEIKTYYRTFVEWHNDNTYYHIIGFLLKIGKKIEYIKNLTEENTKIDLKEKLYLGIKNYFGEINFEQIGYDGDSKKAEDLLLLFNVVTTMNSRYNRFAFDKFMEKKWSLEHIHAQQSEELTDKQKKQLLQEQKEFFSKRNKENLLTEIDNLLIMAKVEQKEFDNFQNKIFKEYSDATLIHSIKNLTLLTVPDNSCLNNNIFPIKRDMIKELDEKGSFIPICTKNVFLKYYSKNVEQNVKWDIQDMTDYLNEIRRVLKPFL